MYSMLTTPVLEQATWRNRLHDPDRRPNLYFTDAWPDYLFVKGKYFKITQTAVVYYTVGYRLPGDDQKNLDLSNTTGGLYLYPERDGEAYEILVGLKPANVQMGIYIPGPDQYLLALGHSSMYPQISDPQRRYLATITPEDSPFDNPLLKLWAVNNMDSWILKLDVLPGVDFESVVLGFRIAKHRLTEISRPENYTTVEYYKSISGVW